MSNLATETAKADPSSPNPDSEYDTASDSPSDEEDDDLHGDDDLDEGELLDDESDLDDEEEDDIEGDEEDGSIVLDLERQRGDGQEQDLENKKKVDTAEDRSNPQYIPKKGTFYEHDDRTADDGGIKVEVAKEGEVEEKQIKEDSPVPVAVKPGKKWQTATAVERWSHDRFDENEQAPKSRSELVSAYGYDIRNEDGPPRARRRRRYGRGPNKYTRKWEDEGAYGKTIQQRKPRPEDFPALGSRSAKQRQQQLQQQNPDESYKENNSDELNKRQHQNRNRYQSDKIKSPILKSRMKKDRDREDRRKDRGDRVERGDRNDRGDRSDRSDRGGSDRGSSGYRVGRPTMLFKNQNLNKSMNESNLSNRLNQQPQSHQMLLQQQHQDNRLNRNSSQSPSPPIMESMSFSNSKLGRSNNNEQNIENYSRNSKEREYLSIGRAIQGGQSHHHQQSHLQQQIQQSNINNQINMQQTNNQYQQQYSTSPSSSTNRHSTNIQNQSQISNAISALQSPQQQQQNSGYTFTNNQQSNNVNTLTAISANAIAAADASRPKRYSSYRQKGLNENLPQQLEQQQIMQMNEQNLLQQSQKLQHSQGVQLAPAKQQPQTPQPSQPQQIPLHIQSELLSLSQKSQPPNILPSQQSQPPGQGQYTGTFFTAGPGGEFNPPAVQTVQQSPVVTQPAGQNPQIVSGSQYPVQFPQPVGGSSFLPPTATAYIQQQTTHSQSQILNYVPTPAQYSTPPQYPAYQNFSTVPPAITPQTPPSAIYQTQSGLTFYAPQTQTQPRPILPQRRPTNAIPIMAPPERGGKGRGRLASVQFDDYEDTSEIKSPTNINSGPIPPLGSAENIDHILDNMFVQRPPYQPPTRKSPPSPVTTIAEQSPPPHQLQSQGGSQQPAANNNSSNIDKKDDSHLVVTSNEITNIDVSEMEKSIKEMSIKDDNSITSSVNNEIDSNKTTNQPTNQNDIIDQPA